MKKRIDEYLDAMLKRGNTLELLLNALWLIPVWLFMRLIATFKQGPVNL